MAKVRVPSQTSGKQGAVAVVALPEVVAVAVVVAVAPEPLAVAIR